MKNVLITLIALVCLTIIPSCKKGENDPFISFRSRDARITGKWKVVNLELIENNNGSINTSILNGSILTETSNGSSTSYSYSANWEILADGVFKYTYITDGELSSGSYTWHWLDDNQTKSKIILNGGGVYVVDRLTNNELVLKYEYGDSDLSNGNNDVDSFSYTVTLEKE
jgi:hypothetical protein